MSTTPYTDPVAPIHDAIRRWADQWQYAIPEEARVQLAERLQAAQADLSAALTPAPLEVA